MNKIEGRYVVLDTQLAECGRGRFSTEAQAVAAAKEECADEYDEGPYYVAELVGVAALKRDPKPVSYKSLRRGKR